MSPLYTLLGKLLLKDGKLATSSSCCCCQCEGPGCCTHDTWSRFFSLFWTFGHPYFCSGGPGVSWYVNYDENQIGTYGLPLYVALKEALPNCGITRPYESQYDCIEAKKAEFQQQNGMTVEEYDQQNPGVNILDDITHCQCGNYYGIDYGWSNPFWFQPGVGGLPLGWSRPLLNGQLVTPELLTQICPGGTRPPDWSREGRTTYWGAPTFGDSIGIPDIRKVVFKDGESTGDPVVDDLFKTGTQNPGMRLFPCSSNPCLNIAYSKYVWFQWSRGGFGNCDFNPDGGNCPPPENCKNVYIQIVKESECVGDTPVTPTPTPEPTPTPATTPTPTPTPESTSTPTCTPTTMPKTTTSWVLTITVCPCSNGSSISGSSGYGTDIGNLIAEAYGFESEADCLANRDTDNWSAFACLGDGWKTISHHDTTVATLYCCDGYYGFSCLPPQNNN